MTFATSRRDFLIAAGSGVTAVSMKPDFLNAAQLPGQAAAQTAGWQQGNFSNVMAIAAHPGDAFFAMGAPVGVAAHFGGQGSLLSLSLGEKGSRTIPAAQYGSSQQEAAQKAAEMLGAKALFLQYPDGEIPANQEAKFAVCDFIRQYKPLTIVTHWKGSWHKDHRACYDIVDDAIFYAGLPSLVRKDPAHEVRKLSFADNWEDATGFIADTYLDITSVFDRWLNACSAFPMWRGENGFRYNDYYGSLAIARGCLSNFKRAVALMSPAEQRVLHIRTPE
ncbi:MAG TPA: PIG-L deacetylase family protein [Candidatus Sulfotelmatobacter sp.]|nr:PIG-L deacetylase family protein [Candidatus Sulfotelmatobacter sp.]